MNRAYLQLALSMSLVGANVAVAKILAESLPIAMVACLRCAIAVVVLVPLVRMFDPPVRPSAGSLRNLAWQALFGTALYNAGLLAGLRLTTALEAGLVLATLPAVVAIGGAVWLRERLPPRQWLAVLIAAGAMAALTLARAAPGAAGSALGNALVFAGICGEAMYVLLGKRLGHALPVLTASLWMQIFSTLILLPFMLLDLPAISALADPKLAGLLLFHSLTASVLCLLLWYAGLKRVPAGMAGVFTAFLPATAAVVAVLVLGETPTLVHGIGFAMMLASVLLATWPARVAR
ncbi:MAG: DMT family transporter [Pseudomonadota bacterium]